MFWLFTKYILTCWARCWLESRMEHQYLCGRNLDEITEHSLSPQAPGFTYGWAWHLLATHSVCIYCHYDSILEYAQARNLEIIPKYSCSSAYHIIQWVLDPISTFWLCSVVSLSIGQPCLVQSPQTEAASTVFSINVCMPHACPYFTWNPLFLSLCHQDKVKLLLGPTELFVNCPLPPSPILSLVICLPTFHAAASLSYLKCPESFIHCLSPGS
jgi:hypothetical protein